MAVTGDLCQIDLPTRHEIGPEGCARRGRATCRASAIVRFTDSGRRAPSAGRADRPGLRRARCRHSKPRDDRVEAMKRRPRRRRGHATPASRASPSPLADQTWRRDVAARPCALRPPCRQRRRNAGARAPMSPTASSAIVLIDDRRCASSTATIAARTSPPTCCPFPRRRAAPRQACRRSRWATSCMALGTVKREAKAQGKTCRRPLSRIWWCMACCICWATITMKAIRRATDGGAWRRKALAGLGIADPYRLKRGSDPAMSDLPPRPRTRGASRNEVDASCADEPVPPGARRGGETDVCATRSRELIEEIEQAEPGEAAARLQRARPAAQRPQARRAHRL